jgi:hypothetical protein
MFVVKHLREGKPHPYLDKKFAIVLPGDVVSMPIILIPDSLILIKQSNL